LPAVDGKKGVGLRLGPTTEIFLDLDPDNDNDND
jgi:hypothetical protein